MKFPVSFLKETRIETLPSFPDVLKWQEEAYAEVDPAAVPPLTRAMRDEFGRTGNREPYEIPFFKRRHFLCAAAFFSLLRPDEPHYLRDLETVLGEILGEWSWAAPPHTAGMGEKGETFIDLFAAELGFAVAEILYLLGDRMSPALVLRAKEEVKRRILSSYESTVFWWEDAKMNWAMVCAGNVAGTMLYLDPDAFARQKERLLKTVNCFLASFPDDGACLEGLGYWHYGVENLLVFADLYERFCGEDLLADGKARKILSYPGKCLMCGDTFPTVADASDDPTLARGLLCRISDRYGVPLPPARLLGIRRGNVGWTEMTRELLWGEKTDAPELPLPACEVFPDAGQAIFRRNRYSLFVKAGNNGEPHNHNDVGSFILSTKEGQIFCDLGAGRYTGDYFRDETRYTRLCASSRGHSVPIVNGEYQRAGEEFCGTLELRGVGAIVDIAAAYGQEKPEKLTRNFICHHDSIGIVDVFSQDARIVERFVTAKKPALCEGGVQVGNVKLLCAADIKPKITEETHALHGFVFGNESGNRGDLPVWLIDFRIPAGARQAVFVIKITPRLF